MHALASLARNLGNASSLLAGVVQLQRDASKLLQIHDVLCLWIDWPRRIAYGANGRVGPEVEDLVTEIAGAGRGAFVSGALVEPLGPPPARAVLALRKRSGSSFTEQERTIIRTLAAGLAPAFDRVLAADRGGAI
ncbi:MAG: hypothetical protein ABI867_08285 [Kofleriaceae bacterium]